MDPTDPEGIHACYRNIIDALPNNVYWLDKNCITLGCNRNVLNLIGLKSYEEFIGITYEQMRKLANWTEGQAESFKKDDMEVISTGKPKLNVEEPPVYDENGNPQYYISSRVPLFDDKNQVIGVVGISVNITDIKKNADDLAKAKEESETAIRTKKEFLEKLSKEVIGNTITYQTAAEEYAIAARQHLENIIACMPGNVYWTDRNSIYYGCNDNVLKMLGLKSKNEFIGMSYEDMAKISGWREEQTEAFKRADEKVMQTGKPMLNIEEDPLIDAQGNEKYFLISRVPLQDKESQIIGMVGISVDITEFKKTQLALQEAKEKAEESNFIKTMFMENMSHDFKTPLNGIYGAIQVLARRDDLPEDLKKLVSVQEKSFLRLKKLVDSILAFDKLYGGKFQLQKA